MGSFSTPYQARSLQTTTQPSSTKQIVIRRQNPWRLKLVFEPQEADAEKDYLHTGDFAHDNPQKQLPFTSKRSRQSCWGNVTLIPAQYAFHRHFAPRHDRSDLRRVD